MSDEAPRKEVNKGYHKDAWLTLAQKIEENVDQAARLFVRGVLLDHRFTRTVAHVPPSDRIAQGEKRVPSMLDDGFIGGYRS